MHDKACLKTLHVTLRILHRNHPTIGDHRKTLANSNADPVMAQSSRFSCILPLLCIQRPHSHFESHKIYFTTIKSPSSGVSFHRIKNPDATILYRGHQEFY
ncbi:hypothetical protein L916_12370 [Phytophthora nicotianae]|uniref:Uncharacterized protein n=1 Tax=Phytophthora nicotianae TaxID=4792 RepID=W2IPN2_PHYNI|nr:hypothetical protein L916_12370 [Phytophthora nicotianae]